MKIKELADLWCEANKAVHVGYTDLLIEEYNKEHLISTDLMKMKQLRLAIDFMKHYKK